VPKRLGPARRAGPCFRSAVNGRRPELLPGQEGKGDLPLQRKQSSRKQASGAERSGEGRTEGARGPALPAFAVHDPDCVLAPGLWRSLPRRKDARKQRLEVVYEKPGNPPYGKPVTVTFLSPDLLGADDMRVLQGLLAVAMGWEDEDVVPLDEKELEGSDRQLMLRFDASSDVYNQLILRVNGSFAQVARAIGLDPRSGRAIQGIRESLDRLAGLTVRVRGGMFGGRYNPRLGSPGGWWRR